MEEQIMKARMITLAFAMMLLTGGRSYGSSEFIMTNIEGSPFYVVLNGDVFYSQGAMIELFHISPGRHSLEVYTYRRTPHGGVSASARLAYRGSFRIGHRIRMITKLTPAGRLVIADRIPIRPPHVATGHGHNSHGTGGGKSGHNAHGTKPGNAGHNSHCAAAVPSPHEFAMLIRTIREASFEQTKLMIAREAIAHRGITSQQVYRIMMQFSFEATKLEFAKWAYTRAVDKSNYFLVHRAFSFESSKRELSRHISAFP